MVPYVLTRLTRGEESVTRYVRDILSGSENVLGQNKHNSATLLTRTEKAPHSPEIVIEVPLNIFLQLSLSGDSRH